MKIFSAFLVLILTAAALSAATAYHLLKTVSVPGDEGYDYCIVDSAAIRSSGPGLQIRSETGKMQFNPFDGVFFLPSAVENPMNPVNGVQTLDDPALVGQAKQGRLDAFDELVHRYGRKIFRLTQHITGNREDAEDALQETFLKAFSRLSQFQGDSQFYTWLVRIAVNESLMKLRKRKTSEAAVSLDEPIETEENFLPREIVAWDENPEQKYARKELQEILDRTIRSLPEIFRHVFVLRDVEQLSTEETAQALNLSVPAVKSRLLRARLQLREKLSKYFQKDGVA